MSYTVNLYFEPAVRQQRIAQYFAGRQNFVVEKDLVSYENPDTGVYFWIRLRCWNNILLQKHVVSAEFEINYHRPSFFGVEAEKQLSAFVTAFQPRIEDPQMYGMGDGPYSGERFLSGWNFGNAFSARGGPSSSLDTVSMPADVLFAAWAWNYHRHERNVSFNDRCFVPKITFFVIEERPSRVVVWPLGMPVSLPLVDYVLVGRTVSGEKRFALACWPEVREVVQRAGFDTTKNPLDLIYSRTPPAIEAWVANIPLIDVDALKRLYPYQILDDEVIAAGRKITEAPP